MAVRNAFAKKMKEIGKTLPGSSLPVNLSFVAEKKEEKVHCST